MQELCAVLAFGCICFAAGMLFTFAGLTYDARRESARRKNRR